MLYTVDMERKSELGKRISELRRLRQMTQADLARALKVTPQAVSGWERDEAMPELERIEALAAALGVDLVHLMSRAGTAAEIYLEEMTAQQEERRRLGKPVPARELVGDGDFPIYAASEGGDGALIVHTEVMEYVKRPSLLSGVPNGYGILVVGESMSPAYRPGDMALVHPNRPLERETDVIVYKHDPRSGDATSMIKRLLTFNDTTLKLEQHNPPRTFSVPRKDWPIAHQVVGKYNSRR